MVFFAVPALAELALTSANQHQIEVLIDGPYGRTPYFAEDAETLVLVAGGIGMNPLR